MRSGQTDPRARNVMPSSNTVSAYFQDYAKALGEAAAKVPAENIERVFKVLEKVIENGKRVYVAGNGGSASISDHLCCDWMKGTHSEHLAPLRVHSLAAHTGLLTALANDFSYEQCFSKQIEMIGEDGDALFVISSSGNSANVLEAAKAARAKKMTVIGFVGFEGGKLRDLSDVYLHVPVSNYGMVEDAHQMLMHAVGQFLAKKRDKK